MDNSPNEKCNTNPRGLYGDPWIALYGLTRLIPLSALGWACIACGFFWGAVLLVAR